MRQQSMPAVGDVIRLDGVTKTYQSRLSGGERQRVAIARALVNAPEGGNPQVGSTLSVTGAPGASALTVVGYANSITNTADGWVTPGEIARPAAALRAE